MNGISSSLTPTYFSAPLTQHANQFPCASSVPSLLSLACLAILNKTP